MCEKSLRGTATVGCMHEGYAHCGRYVGGKTLFPAKAQWLILSDKASYAPRLPFRCDWTPELYSFILSVTADALVRIKSAIKLPSRGHRL